MSAPVDEEKAATARAKVERYAEIATSTDEAVGICLKVIFENCPEDEDAIVSGAMTALVRFGIERQQEAAQKWVAAGQIGRTVTIRDVFAYFAKFVQLAAEILLTKPASPDA